MEEKVKKEETLKKGLIEVLLGSGFKEVDGELVNVSKLQRSFEKENNE
jgi:hypothetical protein